MKIDDIVRRCPLKLGYALLSNDFLVITRKNISRSLIS